MTLGELLLKPALEGLAEYGVASAFDVKDAEALGIGATAGDLTNLRSGDERHAQVDLTGVLVNDHGLNLAKRI